MGGKLQSLSSSNAPRAEGSSAQEQPLSAASAGKNREICNERRPKVAFFGHFGQFNFGNESTLQAILYHLRRSMPDGEFTCICTDPRAVATTYNIAAVPSRTTVAKRWTPRNRLVALARKLVILVPGELAQWLDSVKTLRGTDALIIPGTGLLEDVETLFSWGPYDLFRWSVAAKLCRCKLLFVSVGAGPLDSRTGRCLVKAVLSLANYRSFRDQSTVDYLEGIGFRARNDHIYPDLAFSLPESTLPADREGMGQRPAVGLGLMKVSRGYTADRPTSPVISAYLEALVEFTQWLLSHGYDIRILFGDIADSQVMREFGTLLKQRSVVHEVERLMDTPIGSVDELLKQFAETDFVVATRFHNVVFALLLGKPVIAPSYHHKCTSLMSQMDLSKYCLDVDQLSSAWLIEQFEQLRLDADSVTRVITRNVETYRVMLDEQYDIISAEIRSSRHCRRSMEEGIG